MTDKRKTSADSPDGDPVGEGHRQRLAACLADHLVDHLADRSGAGQEPRQSGRVVELAVGRRPAVAAALAERDIDVLATDVRTREVPQGVPLVVDDLTDPDESVYAGADLLYARNLPAELQRPARDLALAVEVPLYFTTLGAEQPVVPVDRETIGDGSVRATLYRATDAPG